jgi:hypothetical protein
MKGGIHFTEPLHNNYRRDTNRHADLWEGLMKYTVEMGSGGMMYVPSFIKIG